MISDAERTTLTADLQRETLPDVVTVRRQAGSTPSPDPPYTPTVDWTVLHEGIAGRLVSVRPRERQDVIGGEPTWVARYDVTLPPDVDEVTTDDQVVVDASADGTATGRALRVVSVATDSLGVQRRLICEAWQDPERDT